MKRANWIRLGLERGLLSGGPALAATTALGAWLAGVAPALACDPVEHPSEYVVDAESYDTTPPILLDAQVTVRRAENPGVSGTDCSDLGSYRVDVDATDDSTKAEDLGYSLELIEGTLPFDLPRGVAEDPVDDGVFSTWFADDGDSFSGTIEVRVADRAGNLSEPIEVDVSGPHEAAGCSVQAGGSSPLGWTFVLAAWLFARRRNPRRGAADQRAKRRPSKVT